MNADFCLGISVGIVFSEILILVLRYFGFIF